MAELRAEGASADHALVATLLIETVLTYQRRSLRRQASRILSWLAISAVVVVVTILLMAGLTAAINLLAIPNANAWILGLAGIGVVLAMGSRIGLASSRIDLVGNPLISRLKLGRCEASTDFRRLVTCLLMTATLMGLQTSLLCFANVGFEERFSLRDGVLLTIDNVVHGVLFDLGELYNLRIGPEWTHTASTATLFLIFRLAFDATFGTAIYLCYRNLEVQRFLDNFPTDSRRPSDVCRWIDDTVRDPDNWARRLSAECVFLQLVRARLEDRVADLHELDRVLPALQISDSLRAMLCTSRDRTSEQSP